MTNIDKIIEREFATEHRRHFGSSYSAQELRAILKEAVEPYKEAIDCIALHAQELSVAPGWVCIPKVEYDAAIAAAEGK